MNQLIKQQLAKVKTIDLPPIDESNNQLVIPKHIPVQYTLDVGKYYLIELASYIINPPENFTLHQNWNKNIVPKDKYMKAEISAVMGKMVRINGVGFDLETKTDLSSVWEGWVPAKSITILKEL